MFKKHVTFSLGLCSLRVAKPTCTGFVAIFYCGWVNLMWLYTLIFRGHIILYNVACNCRFIDLKCWWCFVVSMEEIVAQVKESIVAIVRMAVKTKSRFDCTTLIYLGQFLINGTDMRWPRHLLNSNSPQRSACPFSRVQTNVDWGLHSLSSYNYLWFNRDDIWKLPCLLKVTLWWWKLPCLTDLLFIAISNLDQSPKNNRLLQYCNRNRYIN